MVVTAGDPAVREILSRHPRVEKVLEGEGFTWSQGDWHRALMIGPECEIYGLPEFMDNNPMVCADHVGVPTDVGTLAAIALGPLIDAGLLQEPPVIVTSWEPEAEDVDEVLAAMGWAEGGSVIPNPAPIEGIRVVTAMAVIATPEDFEAIDELYEERFGRSFFVVRDEEGEWAPELIRGTPRAAYRMRISPGEDTSLLTVMVMADKDGKAGAAQLVHAFNIMCGFEETLGF